MMEVLAQGAGELGLSLTPAQLEQFETYYRELAIWNRKFNLTRIIEYEEVQARHFVDSLTIMPVLRDLFPSPPSPLRIVDVGAGAGMPGLPVKIALPGVRLTLIESVGKKAAFLRHLVEELRLDDVEVVVGRAEDLARRAELREGFDLIVARALAPLPALVELTLPFVRIGGFLIAHKGADVEEEVKASRTAIRILGGRLKETRKLQITHILSPRNLVIIVKVTSTPSGYPRRAGLPSKHPL